MLAADVIIVGGGPVGLLTALGLAQGGARVMVLERETQIIESPRAAVHFPVTLLVLDELGLLDELREIGFANRTFGTHVPEADFHSVVDLAAVEGIAYDYQLHIGQHEVARVALEHARRLGVDVRFGHEVIAIADGADGASVAARHAGGEKTFRGQWLIGADGARSTIRKLAGIAFAGHTWPERFIATNLRCDMRALGYQQANFVCDPVNMAVIAQLDRAGLWRLTYMEDAALPEETFRERIPGRYAAFIPEGVGYEIVSASPYMLHQRAGESLRKGRVLLAGDAAHATNPCGGLGLTSGIWTGVTLADVLGAVLRGEEEPDILDRWSDERRRIFWDIVSPAASENKRMLQEADPERRRADLAAIRALNDDPQSGAMLSLFAYRLIGDTLRPCSRWADADPTPRLGLDLAGRQGQIH